MRIAETFFFCFIFLIGGVLQSQAEVRFSLPTPYDSVEQSVYLQNFHISLKRMLGKLPPAEKQLTEKVVENIMREIVREHMWKTELGLMTKEEVKFAAAKNIASVLNGRTLRNVFNNHLKEIYKSERIKLNQLEKSQCNVHRKYIALKQRNENFENCDGELEPLSQYSIQDDTNLFLERSNKLFLQLKQQQDLLQTICNLSDLCGGKAISD